MLKHIVMWKLKEENKSENAQKIKAMLEALPGIIPQIKSLAVGIDIGADAAGSYDACLITTFDDTAALEIYQNHPEHKKVAAFVATVRENRAVVDFESNA